MKNLPKLIASIVLAQAAGLIGSLFTMQAIPTWYVTLNKPVFSPPNWVFAPVWTTLYTLMGISFFLIWIQGWQKKKVKNASYYYFIQLALNLSWSMLFFGLLSPLLGLINIAALWVMIILTIKHFYPLSKWAAYLLVPYLLWVSFATILNAAILVLN